MLGFVNKGDTRFGSANTKDGLDFMGCNKKNPETKCYKKKDLPHNFEFLADIVRKCIICKDFAHDSISEL